MGLSHDLLDQRDGNFDVCQLSRDVIGYGDPSIVTVKQSSIVSQIVSITKYLASNVFCNANTNNTCIGSVNVNFDIREILKKLAETSRFFGGTQSFPSLPPISGVLLD